MNYRRFIRSAASRLDRVYEILTASKQSISPHRRLSSVKSSLISLRNCLISFILIFILTLPACQTAVKYNSADDNSVKHVIVDTDENQYKVQNIDLHSFFVREVKKPENADLLETMDSYKRYVLLKPIRLGSFQVEADEIIEVYDNEKLKSIVCKNDWLYSDNNYLIPAQGGQRVEFYHSGNLKKIVTSDITSPGTGGNVTVPAGAELLFWESGRNKRILSDNPVRIQADEGSIYLNSPIYFYNSGSIAYSILNDKTDPQVLAYVARGTPLYSYENGNPARETVSEFHDFVIQENVNAMKLTDVYYFSDAAYQQFVFESDSIIDGHILQGGSVINIEKTPSGELQTKFLTFVNDFTIDLWGTQIIVKGGKRIYQYKEQIRRFTVSEDVVISNGYEIQAGTEVILYPDGSLARYAPRIKEVQELTVRQTEYSEVYYYPNEEVMFFRTMCGDHLGLDSEIICEFYFSDTAESLGKVALIPNSRGEVEKTLIEMGEGTLDEIKIKMIEILKKVEEIDNMYLDWEWEWPGYKIFEDFSSGELVIVE